MSQLSACPTNPFHLPAPPLVQLSSWERNRTVSGMFLLPIEHLGSCCCSRSEATKSMKLEHETRFDALYDSYRLSCTFPYGISRFVYLMNAASIYQTLPAISASTHCSLCLEQTPKVQGRLCLSGQCSRFESYICCHNPECAPLILTLPREPGRISVKHKLHLCHTSRQHNHASNKLRSCLWTRMEVR